jgi:hypothetical protein
MAYSRNPTWVDGVGGGTRIDASPLNRLEDGLVAAAAVADGVATQAINTQTGTTYTLVASDAGKLLKLTNAAAITLTVPNAVFTAGQRIDVIVGGAGMVTVAAGAGATVNGTPSLVSRAQWSALTVLFLSASQAVVIGDLA